MPNYNALKNDIYRIRKYIFIGDSYGAGLKMSDTSKNWINKTVENLGLTNSQYYSTAVSGSGFIGQSGVTTFLQQLQGLSISTPHLITDIVVCGGWNDGGQTGADLKVAIKNFINYVKSTFPIAKVWVGYVSWCDSYIINQDNPTWHIRSGLYEYSRCGAYGAAFLGNVEFAMHNTSYFTSDGLHPNEYGQQAIADQVATTLQGGTADVYYYMEASITKGSNINTCPAIWTYIHNETCGVDLFNMSTGPQISFNSNISMKAAGFHNSTSTIIDVCTIDNACVRGGRYSELQASVMGYVQTGGSVNNLVNILIRLGRPDQDKSNTLQIALNAVNDSGIGYKTFNDVSMIWIPTPNVFMNGLSMFC